MSKKTFNTVLFHVVCWLLVALPAVVFVPEHIRQTTAMYFIRLCLPLFLCAVFYINYLWLVPGYVVTRRINVYICINVVVVASLAFGFDRLMDIMHNMEAVAGWGAPPPRNHAPGAMMLLYDFLRKVFPFFLSAALGTSLRLAQRWHEAEAARREMEIQKTEAELNNLRNQINPHFLLNTLNNIYALISFDTDKAQKAVLSLSEMLRQMLYEGKNNAVSLKNEAAFIGNYVELMKLRLSRSVKVDFNVRIPDDVNVVVAPFIFISLVENAFKHGVSTTRPSFVSITIEADSEKITCYIENSNFPKNSSDKSGHGIGLEQVARRLELAYPGKFEWLKGTDEKNNVYYSKITLYDTQPCDNR